jgi:hypothetical protein
MSLKAPVSGSGPRKLPKVGMQHGRCVVVLDLGTHIPPRFPLTDDGKQNWQHLVQIQFELDELMDFNGEKVPMMATKRYTLSSGKKANLRKDLESWYGRKFSDEELKKAGGFDVEKLLGRPALLNIQHSDDGQYANIIAVNPPMSGAAVAPQHYPNRFFDLSKPDPDVWAQISNGTREFISKCKEVVEGKVTLPKLAAKPVPENASEPVSDESAPF